MPVSSNFHSALPWPIWVLSLPDAVERRRRIAAQFDVLGLEFSFLDAVDGRRGLPSEFECDVDRPGTLARHGYGMSDGEYACALSHQEAYRKLLASELPGAIIFEDDAILTERFADFYRNRSYEAAPLIQLFFFDAVIWRGRGRTVPGARLERLSANAWAAVGYSISAQAAARMRHESLPLRSRADWPCDTVGLIGHYVTQPRLVLHPVPTEEQTSLGPTRNDLFPSGFDHSAGYAKGWRRLYSLASWRRLIKRPFTRRLSVGFEPTPEEASHIIVTGHGNW